MNKLEQQLTKAYETIDKLKSSYDTETEMLINAYRCGNSERFNMLLNRRFKDYSDRCSRNDPEVLVGIIGKTNVDYSQAPWAGMKNLIQKNGLQHCTYKLKDGT
jgi:transcriptional regulatory protein LevR